MMKITIPSFSIFAIAAPTAPEIVDLRADEPAVKAGNPANYPGSSVLLATSPAIPSFKDARNTHRSLQVTGTNVDKLGKMGTVFGQLQSADSSVGLT
ncbi:hypothetical protein R1flu_020195 [Riccia fluitans]|uniref:Dirigent protein n=1 Tax=Riccia fluitans TaxID=41844 RepID=A0ABD1ZKU0_9MARC